MEDKRWVDFAAVKASVTMEMVLAHYRITNLKRNDGELRGPCPIHEGNARAQSFSVNIARNVFKCFSCGSRGNVLDFVAMMDECSVKDAALKLDEWFRVTKREAGESAPAAECLPANNADAVTTLIAEVETHVGRSLHHATLVEAKFSALKQLLAAR
jgi:DNA primase